MAYGLSNGHVTLKGQTRDLNTLRAQYLENYLSKRLQIWYAALYGECWVGAQIIFPENGRGLSHVTPTIFGISKSTWASYSIFGTRFCLTTAIWLSGSAY